MGVIIRKVENGFIVSKEAGFFEKPKKYIAKDYPEMTKIIRMLFDGMTNEKEDD